MTEKSPSEGGKSADESDDSNDFKLDDGPPMTQATTPIRRRSTQASKPEDSPDEGGSSAVEADDFDDFEVPDAPLMTKAKTPDRRRSGRAPKPNPRFADSPQGAVVGEGHAAISRARGARRTSSTGHLTGVASESAAGLQEASSGTSKSHTGVGRRLANTPKIEQDKDGEDNGSPTPTSGVKRKQRPTRKKDSVQEGRARTSKRTAAELELKAASMASRDRALARGPKITPTMKRDEGALEVGAVAVSDVQLLLYTFTALVFFKGDTAPQGFRGRVLQANL